MEEHTKPGEWLRSYLSRTQPILDLSGPEFQFEEVKSTSQEEESVCTHTGG